MDPITRYDCTSFFTFHFHLFIHHIIKNKTFNQKKIPARSHTLPLVKSLLFNTQSQAPESTTTQQQTTTTTRKSEFTAVILSCRLLILDLCIIIVFCKTISLILRAEPVLQAKLILIMCNNDNKLNKPENFFAPPIIFWKGEIF